jgi:hypothetical protein
MSHHGAYLCGEVATSIVLDVTRRPIQTRVTRPAEHGEELEVTQIAQRDVLLVGAGGADMLAVGLPQAAAQVRGRRLDHDAGQRLGRDVARVIVTARAASRTAPSAA